MGKFMGKLLNEVGKFCVFDMDAHQKNLRKAWIIKRIECHVNDLPFYSSSNSQALKTFKMWSVIIS